MLRPESSWQDESWDYDAEESYEPAVPPTVEPPPYTPRDIGWWAALALVAIGGALSIVAAAFLCQVIGL